MIGHNARPLDGGYVMSLLFSEEFRSVMFALWCLDFDICSAASLLRDDILPDGTEQIGRGNFYNSTDMPLWQLAVMQYNAHFNGYINRSCATYD